MKGGGDGGVPEKEGKTGRERQSAEVECRVTFL